MEMSAVSPASRGPVSDPAPPVPREAHPHLGASCCSRGCDLRFQSRSGARRTGGAAGHGQHGVNGGLWKGLQ